MQAVRCSEKSMHFFQKTCCHTAKCSPAQLYQKTNYLHVTDHVGVWYSLLRLVSNKQYQNCRLVCEEDHRWCQTYTATASNHCRAISSIDGWVRSWQLKPKFIHTVRYISRSQWQRGLRRGSVDARPLRLWVRNPPGAWMSLCCECCVLSGRGLCDELITSTEESYRLFAS